MLLLPPAPRRAQAYIATQDLVEAEVDIKKGLAAEPGHKELQVRGGAGCWVLGAGEGCDCWLVAASASWSPGACKYQRVVSS